MERIELMRESDDTFHKGQLLRHDIKPCAKSPSVIIFYILMTIYVDDTAVPFTSRNQLVKGMSIIYSILAQLGLEMHVGKQIDGEWGASKTECIFFPEGAFFKQQAVEMELPARGVLALSEGAEEKSDAAREKKESLEEMLYNQCDETAPVSVGEEGLPSAAISNTLAILWPLMEEMTMPLI